MELLKQLKKDANGLVGAIVQDAATDEVLMFAFMNESAIQKTVETGLAHYYSRSRNKLWLKGESSGNTQKVVEMRVDCDMDCILIRVQQKGGACHAGYQSCFYRKVENGGDTLTIDRERLFDPDEVYKKKE